MVVTVGRMAMPTKRESSTTPRQDIEDEPHGDPPPILQGASPQALRESKRFFSKHLRMSKLGFKKAKTERQRKQWAKLIAGCEFCLNDVARSAAAGARHRAALRGIEREIVLGTPEQQGKAMLRLMQLDKERERDLARPLIPSG